MGLNLNPNLSRGLNLNLNPDLNRGLSPNLSPILIPLPSRPLKVLPLASALLLAFQLACQPADDPPEPPAENDSEACSDYGAPEFIGRINDPLLDEASGLCASRDHEGVLYLHNDSGADAIIHAVSSTAQALAHFQVEGASNRDWEDIACAPCELGSPRNCLYIGDIGDNKHHHEFVTIYVVPEPKDPTTSATLPVLRTLKVRYDQGPRDVEALMVHPQTLDTYLVSKFEQNGRYPVLKVSGLESGEVKARTVAKAHPISVRPAQFTAGDIHPNGKRLLLRTYSSYQEHRLPEDAQHFEEIFETEPWEIISPLGDGLEVQGEALGYRAGGLGFFSVPEGKEPVMNAWGCEE